MPEPSGDTHVMQCMEVWGGNQAMNNGVVMPGLSAWVFARPHAGSAAGGDIHYVSSCATGRITRVLLADVAGHGSIVAAAATMLRDLMRRYVNVIDQRVLVRSLNRGFGAASSEGRFATAVVATYFAPSRRLVVSNAGHPRPFLWRARERAWSMLASESAASAPDEPSNLPLGVLEPTTYDERAIRLYPGDLVLFYSDSLVEARGADGKMLGEAGLARALEGIDAGAPERLVPTLAERLAPASDDDVTAMLFRADDGPARRSLGDSIAAAAEFARLLFARLARRGRSPIPWPEWSGANILGAFSDRLGRLLSPRDRGPNS